MIIAISFEGTIVNDEYPMIGGPIPHAFDVMKLLIKQGHKLVLYTPRRGTKLDEAIEFCKKRGVEFWAVNRSNDDFYVTSPKIKADMFVDNLSYGSYKTLDGQFDWTYLIEDMNELIKAKKKKKRVTA